MLSSVKPLGFTYIMGLGIYKMVTLKIIPNHQSKNPIPSSTSAIPPSASIRRPSAGPRWPSAGHCLSLRHSLLFRVASLVLIDYPSSSVVERPGKWSTCERFGCTKGVKESNCARDKLLSRLEPVFYFLKHKTYLRLTLTLGLALSVLFCLGLGLLFFAFTFL